MRKGLIATGVVCWLVWVAPAAADTDVELLGDAGDGSRAIPVHLINLLDEEGQKITPDDEPLMPFSTRQTCGNGCHNVEKISKGWHFNAAEPNVAAGRPGQPWILIDAGTGTQIPLSYRPWPGTYRPEQLGLSPWQFVQIFGRHMPGGGVGELESDNPDEVMRGFVSGKLEVNCLSCHDADPAHNQGEYAVQIARQNFRWAAAATSSFVSVSGSARSMPDTYDPFMPDVLDDPRLVPPAVVYRENTFDHKKQVFFDIVRKIPAERCYFCHSNVNVDKDGAEKWTADEDVHLAAGLTCVDCHRHGLDHNIVRGYEGEDTASNNPLAATTSCEGCHTTGRLGAPVPQHPGIPPVHFDKLTCTACHSGPWPVGETVLTKTSRAHRLGTPNVNKAQEVLPHIVSPVFARQSGIGAAYVGALLTLKVDKIAPHKVLWPAYWGILEDDRVKPIELAVVEKVVGGVFADLELPATGGWPALTLENITKALMALKKDIQGQAVYVAGGNLYSLAGSGKLSEQWDHPAARSYLWPIAHNVRPVAQSLGVRRCEDCHSTDEPFFFGRVEVDTPIASEKSSVKRMIEFQELRPVYTKLFAFSFIFRLFLKVVALCSSAILAAVLLLYALKALDCIAKVLAGKS